MGMCPARFGPQGGGERGAPMARRTGSATLVLGGRGMDKKEMDHYLTGISLPAGQHHRCRCWLPFPNSTSGDDCIAWAEADSPVCQGCANNHWNADGTSRG